MSNTPAELTLQHLERLKAEICIYLTSTEERIAELEADGVVQRSRVEELAEILKKIADRELEIGVGGISGYAAETYSETGIEDVRTKIRNILDTFNPTSHEIYPKAQLIEVFSGFRTKMISMLNTIDLAIVGLRNGTAAYKPPQPKMPASDRSTSLSRAALGSSAIIRSQEVERQRLAREIHDGPAQAIANVVLRMDILNKVYEKDPSRVPEELARMKNIAQGALDEIRGFIFDLRPMTLQDLGLVATIKRIVTALKEMTSIDVRLVIEGEERSLGHLITLAVFRIAQEAINNLRKYSKCTTAWIQLKYLDGKVILIVEDNGVGFDFCEVEQSQKRYTSFGLLGMQERADDINAELEIITSRGEGTKVVLVVPTKDNPALEASLDKKK